MIGGFLPVATLWWREVVRFCRQRSRVVGAFAQPVLFWLLLGGGLGASFQPPGAPPGTGYLEYFYPGTIALVVLFTAIFATISTVEDRQRGFLQGVLVAPVPRASIVLGQALGGTTLALGQGLLLLLLAPLLGIPLSILSVLSVVGVMFFMGFGLTSLGLVIAWRMDSTQGFHAIMNLILIPLWLLSGAFFPASGVPPWLAWAMRLDPLTYSVAALRRTLYLGNAAAAVGVPPLAPSLVITVLFALFAFLAATGVARRSAA
ncbi:MAG: ABC transporter permease [candidate division NC10 bacterium]|nr:ABC transporter permease [candidate division NC10 bacterium]